MNLRRMDYKKKLNLVGLLICVPLLVVVLLFNYLVTGPIQQRLSKEYGVTIKTHIESLDKQVNQIETFSNNMSISLNTNKLVSDLQLGQDSAELKRVANQIFLLENSNLLVNKSVIAVFNDNPYVITANGTSTSLFNQFKDFTLDQTGEKSFQSWQVKKNKLYLVQNISSIGLEKAILVVQIDTKRLLNSLTSSVGSENAIVTVGNHIFSNHESSKLENKILTNSKKNQQNSMKSDGKLWSTTRIAYSHKNHIWNYFVSSSLSDIFSPISKFSFIILSAGILAILGTFLATLVYKKLTNRPIKEFIQDISKGEELTYIDEINYMRNRWKELIDNQNEMSEKNKKNMKELKSTFIMNVIQNRFSYYSCTELDSLGKKYGISFDANMTYRFLHFKITDDISGKRKIDKDSNFSRFILENIIFDVSANYFYEVIEIFNQKNELILFAHGDENMNLQEYFKVVFSSINETMGKWLTITVGEKLIKWEDISTGFSDIQSYHTMQKMKGKNQIITISKEKKNSVNEYLPSIDILEEKIITSTKKGQTSSQEELIYAFIGIFIDGNKSQKYFLQSLIHLRAEISNLLKAKDISTNVIARESDMIDKISSIFKIDEIVDIVMEDLIIPATEAIFTVEMDSTSKKVNQAITYVKENYRNPDISLEQTADKFELETHTLSREFKKRVGSSYIEYLTELRIEKAKYLLRNTDEKISDIAQQVSYHHSYFTRIFKRKVGVTPGEYRKGI